MANKAKTNQKLTQLLLDLKSESESKVASAIIDLASYGDVTIIPELIRVLKLKSSENHQKQIAKLLADIQVSDAADFFVQEIRREENTEILHLVLPILWESKLDFSSYFADFVEISVSGDYLIALDCLTILENMPGPFSESQLLEAQLHLKEFVEIKGELDERKAQILSEIAVFVKDQNEGIDADLLFE